MKHKGQSIMLSSRTSPRRSARRATTSSSVSQSTAGGTPRNHARGLSVASLPSTRAAGPPLTASDVFEVVADGNADMLMEMIEFSGARHLCKLRSKKQEDYGRNLLHCAVTNGQLKTLEVLLDHDCFDPNQVDSVYTRSTPMMEAVKIGRLDLIESLIQAGGRLDVQDVNGDSVLHWAAREVSAAFLRQVLQLARKHGSTGPQLLTALQLTNNSGENAADVGANDVARKSIRRLVLGEEKPGLPPRKNNSGGLRPSSQSGVSKTRRFLSTAQGPSQLTLTPTGGGAPPTLLPSTMIRPRPRSAAAAMASHSAATARDIVGEMPAGVVPGAVAAVGAASAGVALAPGQGEVGGAVAKTETGAAGKAMLLESKEAMLLPKVKRVACNDEIIDGANSAGNTVNVRVRALSTPTPLIPWSGASR